MPALVSLQLAKAHLRVDHSDDDDAIWLYINAVSGFIVNYLKDQADAVLGLDSGGDLPSGTYAPYVVQIAALLWISRMYDNREPDENSAIMDQGYPPREVASLLHQLRDPALR